MIDDLLDFARFPRGGIKLNKTSIDLREVVEDAGETVRPIIQQRRHELRASVPDIAPTIEVDRLRLDQVLINLLDNAAKYTDEVGRSRCTWRLRGHAR